MGTVACPLYGQGSPGKGKCLTDAQRLERDGKIRDMVLAGRKNSDICERLHISTCTLKRTKMRLREQGEIT